MTPLQWAYLILLPLVPLVPLVIFCGLWLSRGGHRAAQLAPYSPLPALVLAMLPAADADLHLPWLLFGGDLGLDEIGRIFLFLTALLWLAAGLYARAYLAEDPRRRRFWAFFLLAMSGNLGLPLAVDLINFYFFFALMSFSAYGLVIHEGRPFALRAGRIYLYLVLLGEVLIFAGLALTVRATGSIVLSEASAALAEIAHRDVILACLIAGFGIKAGMVPLHVWLPLAHPAAPIPASAVLSGAMIKAGLLGLIRLLPLGAAVLPGWSHALIILGLIMAFYGVLAGLPQIQAKTVLAYSSISQMGFPIIGLGLGLADPQGWKILGPGLAVYALHHGLAKGSLFLGVWMAPSLKKGGGKRILVLAGLLIPSLALAGAPLTSGALAKAGLKPFIKEASPLWSASLPLLLSLAAVGTTLVMVRFLFVLWPRDRSSHYPDPLMGTGWGMLVLAVLICSAGWLPGPTPSVDLSSEFLGMLWPAAVGATLAALAWKWIWQPASDKALLPPGDLVVPLERAAVSLNNIVLRWWPHPLKKDSRQRPSALALWHRFGLLLGEAEQALRRIPVAGILFLLIVLLLLAW